MIVISHPTGNANSRQNALALQETGLLAEFWTTVAWDPKRALAKWIPSSVRIELERRTFSELPSRKVKTRPLREMGRQLAGRCRIRSLVRHDQSFFSIDAICHDLDRRVASRLGGTAKFSGVLASEDGAEATFRVARKQGIQSIYELPIGYWRFGQKIFAEEAGLEPAWAATLTGRADSPAKLTRKDEELCLADHIIVASSFTKRTLKAAPFEIAPVSVIPYGCPPPAAEPPNVESNGPLRVLFVGGLGQRKGLSYLLAAVASLKRRASLTLIGRKTTEQCPALNRAVGEHRWIPSLPHAGILAEMHQHDVLVFPSLFEGFGLVLLEAISQGVPVIATKYTGAPDVITDGLEGFIVPLRSSEAIAEKLELLHRDRGLLREMQHAALKRAGELGWEHYRHRIAAIVHQVIDGTSVPAI